MKTLTVSLRSARRASSVISDVRVLNISLESTSSNEWLLQTEEEEEEDDLEDTIRVYFEIAGITDDEFDIEEV